MNRLADAGHFVCAASSASDGCRRGSRGESSPRDGPGNSGALRETTGLPPGARRVVDAGPAEHHRRVNAGFIEKNQTSATRPARPRRGDRFGGPDRFFFDGPSRADTARDRRQTGRRAARPSARLRCDPVAPRSARPGCAILSLADGFTATSEQGPFSEIHRIGLIGPPALVHAADVKKRCSRGGRTLSARRARTASASATSRR